MRPHGYTWKIGPEYGCSRELRTNKPVTANTVLIDLYDGRRYLVQWVGPSKPIDKADSVLPDTLIQTWPAGTLNDEELGKLRERVKYTREEDYVPLADVVFFPAAA